MKMGNAANAPFSAALADGKGKKRMCFINVVPFFPAKVDYMVSEAKRLAETAGLTNPAYSMTLQPEGSDPMKKIRYFAEKFGELRKKLEGTSVQPGILIQSILGHGWNGQTICGKNWHYTININGKTTYRMCPEEPEFLQYVREIFLALAPHRPAFFLTDDDLRLIYHAAVETFRQNTMDIFLDCPGREGPRYCAWSSARRLRRLAHVGEHPTRHHGHGRDTSCRRRIRQ